MKRVCALLLVLLAGCAETPERAKRDPVELLAARRGEDTMRELERREIYDRFLRRAEAKPGGTLDVLVISGGGDWGAFGAGVLKGWERVRGPLARIPSYRVRTASGSRIMSASTCRK